MKHAARSLPSSPSMRRRVPRAGLVAVALALAVALSLIAPRPAPARAATFTVTPASGSEFLVGQLMRFQADVAGTVSEGFVPGAEAPRLLRINTDRSSSTPGLCVASRDLGFGGFGVDIDITGPSLALGWVFQHFACQGPGLRAGDYIVSLDYYLALANGTTSIRTIDIPIRVIGDRDGDGVLDSSDNCPDTPNPTQTDTNGNGKGDPCDVDPNDRDSDGVVNAADNCPDHFNPSQVNSDADPQGDACDAYPFDRDNDGVGDAADNCPTVFNPTQDDDNGNGVGNACETDLDGDGVPNTSDNCPLIANPDQLDSDLIPDRLGDACDPPDSDGDSHSDEDDNCPGAANPEQRDANSDGEGDACDLNDDSDGDTVLDHLDNCPSRANLAQTDADHDGIGDACERDDTDSDGVENYLDNCVYDFNPGQFDADTDGIGDLCDPDRDEDGDGLPNVTDNCDFVRNANQADANANGIGDACDTADTDGDGMSDAQETVTGTSTTGTTALAPGINAYEDGELVGTSSAATAGNAVGVAIVAPAGVNAVAITVTDARGAVAYSGTLTPQSPVVFRFTPGSPGAWRIVAKLYAGAAQVGTLERLIAVQGCAAGGRPQSRDAAPQPPGCGVRSGGR